MPGETNSIPARQCGVAVQESSGNVMAMRHSLGNAAKPSVADIADSEGFAVGDAQLEMSSPNTYGYGSRKAVLRGSL